MSPTRREFIKRAGIAFASLMAARCACLPLVEGGSGGTPRERLRRCWQRFDWLERQTGDWQDYEKGEKALEQLKAEHRAALDELVAAGELDGSVADEVQNAFDAAAYHVWRSYAPITCYKPAVPDYAPESAGQLVRQAELLAGMVGDGTVDQTTVARAQAAIERDVAFMNLSSEEEGLLYEELVAEAGGSYDFPSFDELDLEITPEAAKAAQFLVDLLLE
jgi:hypothetical protein